MAAELTARKPTLAVFASEKGAGDPERASIMSLAGSLIARRGARIVTLAQGATLAVPLITSARAAGGEVLIVADNQIQLPPALLDVAVERHAEVEARLERMAHLADLLVGLPGSLASASDLYKSWVRTGSAKPVVLLNRNRAFEVIRGLAADVLSHSVKRQERMLVFTDNVEDLWNKISWALSEAGRPVT